MHEPNTKGTVSILFHLLMKVKADALTDIAAIRLRFDPTKSSQEYLNIGM